MKLSAILLSLLALLPATALGQTVFCHNGLLPCVENAECINNRCTCSTGFVGNGRVACMPATERCVCSVLQDPKFHYFDGQTAKVNMPCSVLLVKTNLVSTFPFCLVDHVIAHMETRGSGSSQYQRVFVNSVTVKVSSPSFDFTLSEDGVDPASAPVTVVSDNGDGFTTATVQNCEDLEVGFNHTYGAAYVSWPASATISTPGLCGNCDGMQNDNVGSTNETHLAHYLMHLATSSDQEGPFSSECGVVQSLMSSTCQNKEDDVASVCGRFLGPFGSCLIDDTTVTDVTDYASLLLNKFVLCMQILCTSTTAAACAFVDDSQTSSCVLGPDPTACT